MENLEFLAVLGVLAAISAWYFLNEERGAAGELGLLALKPDRAHQPAGRRRYRIKERSARRDGVIRSVAEAKDAQTAPPSYRMRDDGARMRQRFRRQDEIRYRVKDKKAGKR